METIKAECSSCTGTGIYCGMAERHGTGVVCLQCGGTGYKTIQYTPFTGRKRRNDVNSVSQSRGSFIGTGVGAVGRSISYEEFFSGKMP